jgi:glycogen synthase
VKIINFDVDALQNPAGGGTARVTFELARRLAPRHDVTVFTARFPGSHDAVVDGVKYRHIGFSDVFPWNKLSYQLMMPLLARREKTADLVLETFGPPFTCMGTPLYTRAAVVALVPYLFGRQLGAKYHLPLGVVEARGVRLYNKFVAPSRRIAEQLRAYNPRSETAVIPYGVEPEFYEVPLAKGEYLAYVGRIDIYQKGLDLLLYALSRIPGHLRPPLRIFGAGRDDQKLRSLVHSLGLEKHVQHMGRVEGRDRLEALAQARAVCVPSRFETFGLVFVEAMAAGKPPIGFSGVGFEEIVSDADCAVLVESGNILALADAILGLWSNPDRCVALGKAGRQRALAFNWDDLAVEQERLFEVAAETRAKSH